MFEGNGIMKIFTIKCVLFENQQSLVQTDSTLLQIMLKMTRKQ